MSKRLVSWNKERVKISTTQGNGHIIRWSDDTAEYYLIPSDALLEGM